MSITPDAVREEIRENALVEGNPVKLSTKLAAIASLPMYVDSNSQFKTGAFPFAVPIAPANSTDAVLDLTGTVNGNIMTQTLVAAASATTFTSGGYARITLTSANGAILSTGAYYVQFGTLT
jgi:hypothetical protein